jgi:hypothetical protein
MGRGALARGRKIIRATFVRSSLRSGAEFPRISREVYTMVPLRKTRGADLLG